MPRPDFSVYVDGYNIIHSWPPYEELLEEDYDIARSKLIEEMVEYHTLTGNKLTLVFDAHRVKGKSQVKKTYRGITIVYTKSQETADLYIEKTIKNERKDYRFMVVSNDSMIQQIVLGRGGLRVPVREFMSDIEDKKKLLRDREERKKNIDFDCVVSIGDIIKEFDLKD